jgi:cytochrome c peroxidase
MKTSVDERRSLVLIVCCLAFVSVFLMKSSVEVAARAPQGPAATAASAEVALCGGEPCTAVVRGGLAFLDRRLRGLNGNGRACADCHMPADNFQLSPASAEMRFRLMKLVQRFNPDFDDPLFRPIDADDFRTNHEAASDFSNLRQNGLIRVVLQLPLNGKVKLVDPATDKVSDQTDVDIWRMVPTVNDVKLTGNDSLNPWFREPNPTGGYQLDARFATLQAQAHGALVAHAQIQNPVSSTLLDDLASFQRVLFTNNRVRALSKAIDEGTVPLPDPDPRLNELEQQGKAVFERACSICHGGPGQSTSPLTPVPVVRYHDILTQCPRPVDQNVPARFAFKPCPERLARNAKTYEIIVSPPTPGPGGLLIPAGTTVRRRSSDPGRALHTGFVGGAPPFDDWNKLDVPGLRGIRNTAPYFHNNSANTLEEVVDHYIELFKFIKVSAPPVPPAPPVASTDGVHFDRQPQPEERAALLAYLRKL